MNKKQKMWFYLNLLAIALCPFVAGVNLIHVATLDLNYIQRFIAWFNIGVCSMGPSFGLILSIIDRYIDINDSKREE